MLTHFGNCKKLRLIFYFFYYKKFLFHFLISKNLNINAVSFMDFDFDKQVGNE